MRDLVKSKWTDASGEENERNKEKGGKKYLRDKEKERDWRREQKINKISWLVNVHFNATQGIKCSKITMIAKGEKQVQHQQQVK